MTSVLVTLVVLLVAITVVELAVGVPARTTLGSLVRRVLTGSQLSDSWRIMGLAVDHLRAADGTRVYDALFFEERVKFQYPISSLLFVWGLSTRILSVLSHIALGLTAWATWIILRRAVAATGVTPAPHGVVAFGSVVLLTLLFYPVVGAYAIGQIQTWINAIFAWMLVAWMTGRVRSAGMLLGLILLIKPALAPLLLWGVLRRRSGFVTAAVGVALSGTMIGVALFGLDNTLGYVDVVRYIGARGEAFYPNQSWNGLLNRLFENGDALRFDRHAFAPPHAGVYVGTLLAALVTIGLALWVPTRQVGAGNTVDLSVMALTVTMASPVAWDHHYGILLPIAALVMPAILTSRPLGRATWPFAITIYVLSAQTFYPLVAPVLHSPWNLVQSYQFIAAGGMLWLCYRALNLAAAQRT